MHFSSTCHTYMTNRCCLILTKIVGNNMPLVQTPKFIFLKILFKKIQMCVFVKNVWVLLCCYWNISLKRVLNLPVAPSCAFSPCESRNMWGNCCTPMLQQEQDWREIPDRQMLLLPWTGGRNDESGAIMCRRYAWCLLFLLVILILFPGHDAKDCKTVADVGGSGWGGGEVWDFHGSQQLWILQNQIAHHFIVQGLY